MTKILDEPATEAAINARRAELGIDSFDEVWDGVAIVSPAPGSSHQSLLFLLHQLMHMLVDAHGTGRTLQTVNISDSLDHWTENYWVPDLSIFLTGNPARDFETHWLGGPDFAVEILSPGDRSRQKLDFYAKVGVRELLIVDRDPWSLELYRLDRGLLAMVGKVTPDDGHGLVSEVIPLRFGLVAGEARPAITAAHSDGNRSWSI
jgi:Uma2 family endonuclease